MLCCAHQGAVIGCQFELNIHSTANLISQIAEVALKQMMGNNLKLVAMINMAPRNSMKCSHPIRPSHDTSCLTAYQDIFFNQAWAICVAKLVDSHLPGNPLSPSRFSSTLPSTQSTHMDFIHATKKSLKPLSSCWCTCMKDMQFKSTCVLLVNWLTALQKGGFTIIF